MCLKESCLPNCWKVSSVCPVLKNFGERCTGKNYDPVSLLSVVSKVFEKLVNNRLVYHLEKCGLLLISSMILGLLDQLQIFWQLGSDRIARTFNRYGFTQAVALDISKAFERVWDAGRLLKIKSYRISGQIFVLISSFLSNNLLRVILDEKFSKKYPIKAEEYPINPGALQDYILDPTLLLLYINDLLNEVVYKIAIC